MSKKIIQTIGGIVGGFAIGAGVNMIHPGLGLILFGVIILVLCKGVK